MVKGTRLQRKKCSYQIKSPEMEDKDILTVGDKQKNVLFVSHGYILCISERPALCEFVHVTQSMSEAGYPYDNARMDCLSTSYRECSAYVKDKAAKGGAKHPLHTRNTPVISK